MDILIKSFNRPYCLDRCLQSIEMFVVNYSKIVILDDGTPEKYLNKIKQLYPKIQIIKSDFYQEKATAIENNETLPYKIPIDLWIDAAQNATENFVLIEDDFWFTVTINLNNFNDLMKQNSIKMCKLFWLGNPKLLPKKYTVLNDFISIFKPQIPIKNPFLFQLVYVFNKLKSRRILNLFSIFTEDKKLRYYTIYSVAGVIFTKKYFLNLWKNHNNNVDENLQLTNAVRYISKEKNATFGFSNQEILKTGLSTAATNQYKEDFEVSIDMFQFNKIVNEIWLKNEFDVMNNFPKDFDENYILMILKNSNQNQIIPENWRIWANLLKKQYRNFGCQID